MSLRLVAYYRVSTEKQERSGLGLAAQRELVERYAQSNGFTLASEFTETESGARDDRPQLTNAVREARKLSAVLAVAKLDRLSRNATFLLKFDDLVKRTGIDFRIVDQPHLDRFTLGIHALIAERERTLISERTKAALAAARRNGIRLGSRDTEKLSRSGVAALRARAEQRAHLMCPVVQQLQQHGVTTCAALADALNRCGIPTPRSGKWHPESVRRLLSKCES